MPMKPSHTLLAIILAASAATRAQVVPAAIGPASTDESSGLPVNGTLHYTVRYSQTAQFGGIQDGQQMSYTTGDAGYANTGKRLPFSMQYGGGYGRVWAGPPSAGNVFQHLSISQGMAGRTWNLMASDNVSYTYETPTTGFAGVPGTGEPIGGTGTTTPPDQTVLTLNTRVFDNFTTIGFGHSLDFATTLNLGGSSGQMRYIDQNGQNIDTWMADAGVTRRLNARNSFSGQYSLSRFNYVGSIQAANAAQISYSQANTVQFSLSRQWNPHLVTSASLGPQWISSSNSAIVPSSTRISANASAIDTFRFGTASLIYSHGTTGGSGYMLGAESDIAMASFGRSFGKNLTVGLTGSYMRTAGLSNSGVTTGEYGGAQATRKLGRYFNVFASYTAVDQSSSLLNAPNVLNTLWQTIGFGIGYSPRELRLKK
jgi:hypothetical protein